MRNGKKSRGEGTEKGGFLELGKENATETRCRHATLEGRGRGVASSKKKISLPEAEDLKYEKTEMH